MRRMLLLVGMSPLALAAAMGPAPAKEAAIARYAKVNAEVAQPARLSYARHAKRGHGASVVPRRTLGQRGDVLVYRRVKPPRHWAGDGTDPLLQCLLSQPFVNCP